MSAAIPPQPTAAMLVIGDEILSGRTKDANAGHLAERLAESGLALREIRVVADERAPIVEAVRALSSRYDHLFTSGGIGPTHDDITADCVAEAFGRGIDVRADAREILEAYYGAAGINAARLRMARIPDGATLIDNPISRAPGFTLENVHVLAGVPIIFREMLAGLLSRVEGGPPARAWSFRAAIPEGDLAEDLRALAAEHRAVAIGSYPFYRGGLGTTVTLRCTDPAALEAAATALRAVLSARGAEMAETQPSPPTPPAADEDPGA